MRAAGYDRAFVDDAGNAVGELGDPSASRTIVLLGHIDTVPGNIPVRIEAAKAQKAICCIGRGSVDAKGPLATFVAGAARFGSAAREGRRSPGRRGRRRRRRSGHQQGRALHRVALRRHNANRFRPPASSASRATGIASRLATRAGCCSTSPPISRWPTPPVPMRASRRSSSTSGTGSPRTPPRVNDGKDKVFDQLSPSLRRFITSTNDQMHDTVDAQFAWRLPVGFDAEAFMKELEAGRPTGQQASRPAGSRPRSS